MRKTDDGTIVVTPAVLVLLISAALSLGAGGITAISPAVQLDAIQKCYDNSEIAIEVAAQHGQEHVQINAAIKNNRDAIFEQTRDRYTGEDAAQNWRDHARAHDVINRRLDYLERQHD